MKTPVQILKGAKTLLAKPENWNQGGYFKDNNPETNCWCIFGAVSRGAGMCEPDGPSTADVFLVGAIPKTYDYNETGVIEFNDDPRTTFEDIHALLDRAIKAAEAAA